MKDSKSSTKILLVAGIGGHGEQMKRLRRLLPFDNVSIIAEPGLAWKGDRFYYAPRVVDYQKSSKVKSLFNFLRVLMVAIKVCISFRPKLVISTGPALAVPVCAVAKIFGIKVVHIESWSRIGSISNTTKLIRRYNLADLTIYQYEDHILAGEEKCEYWGHL